MDLKISFKQRSQIAIQKLSTQSSTTLQEAKQQAKWLKEVSSTKIKKQRV